MARKSNENSSIYYDFVSWNKLLFETPIFVPQSRRIALHGTASNSSLVANTKNKTKRVKNNADCLSFWCSIHINLITYHSKDFKKITGSLGIFVSWNNIYGRLVIKIFLKKYRQTQLYKMIKKRRTKFQKLKKK